MEAAWALRGYEQMLTDLIVDPDLASAILDIPYHYHLAAARRLVEMGVDMIWVGDDVGSQAGMLISPALWRRWCLCWASGNSSWRELRAANGSMFPPMCLKRLLTG